MTRRDYLGEFEHVVLLAIAHLGDRGYGTTIRRDIERRTGRPVTVGAIYATLGRLEAKGFVESWTGESTSRRGGRAKRHFRLLPAGAEALESTRAMLDRMWKDVDLAKSGHA